MRGALLTFLELSDERVVIGVALVASAVAEVIAPVALVDAAVSVSHDSFAVALASDQFSLVKSIIVFLDAKALALLELFPVHFLAFQRPVSLQVFPVFSDQNLSLASARLRSSFVLALDPWALLARHCAVRRVVRAGGNPLSV